MPRLTKQQMEEQKRGQRLNESLVALVNKEKRESESEFQAYYRRCKLWYDLYRGVYTQQYHGFRNSISIPFMYSIIQSDVARKVQMSFGQFPFVNFEGYAPEEEPIAKKNELLIGIQMEDCNMYRKAVDFFTTMDLYGVGIMREGWKQDRRLEKIRLPGYLVGSREKEAEKEHWINRFDGPDTYVVDPLDFFPQVGFRYIEDMGYCIERYYREFDDLMEELIAYEEAGEEPCIDRSALLEVEKLGFSAEAESSIYERNSYTRNVAAYSNRTQRFRKPVEVWERWGTVPYEFAPDGQRHRKVVILNGKVLGKNIPNPYHHGQKPYTSCSIGDPHFFHGIGKSEILSKLQAASNRIMNHKLDSLDLSISPALIVGANSGLDSSRPLHMTPGKILQLDTQTVGEDIIRPYVPNLQGLQAAAVEIQTLWTYMQQGSGMMEDIAMGGQSSQEQTAREFQGRQEAVMTRLMSESRQAEEGWLEPLANRFRALNRQYLTVPREVRILGSYATINPTTGQPMQQETIGYEDLWPDYKARAVGSNQNLLRSTQRQDIMQILQASSANQELMMAVNWGNFARQMFNIFGFRNVNELLRQIQPGLADQIGQMQTDGTQPGQPGPGPSDNLSPGNLPAVNDMGGGVGVQQY